MNAIFATQDERKPHLFLCFSMASRQAAWDSYQPVPVRELVLGAQQVGPLHNGPLLFARLCVHMAARVNRIVADQA